MHDDPPPIRRAAARLPRRWPCAGLVVAGLVRPAIFFFAPARDDGVVTVGTLAEAREAPVIRDLILSRSYGYDGERDAGDGRVQLDRHPRQRPGWVGDAR